MRLNPMSSTSTRAADGRGEARRRARDLPDQEGQGEVEDDRVHRVSAREAEVWQHVSPRQLRTRALEEGLHEGVEGDATGKGHRDEHGVASAAQHHETDHRDRPQDDETLVGSQGGHVVHERVQGRRRELVDQGRGDGVERVRFLGLHPVRDHAQDDQAAADGEEAEDDRQLGRARRRGDLRGAVGRRLRQAWPVLEPSISRPGQQHEHGHDPDRAHEAGQHIAGVVGVQRHAGDGHQHDEGRQHERDDEFEPPGQASCATSARR